MNESKKLVVCRDDLIASVGCKSEIVRKEQERKRNEKEEDGNNKKE